MNRDNFVAAVRRTPEEPVEIVVRGGDMDLLIAAAQVFKREGDAWCMRLVSTKTGDGLQVETMDLDIPGSAEILVVWITEGSVRSEQRGARVSQSTLWTAAVLTDMQVRQYFAMQFQQQQAQMQANAADTTRIRRLLANGNT